MQGYVKDFRVGVHWQVSEAQLKNLQLQQIIGIDSEPGTGSGGPATTGPRPEGRMQPTAHLDVLDTSSDPS